MAIHWKKMKWKKKPCTRNRWSAWSETLNRCCCCCCYFYWSMADATRMITITFSMVTKSTHITFFSASLLATNEKWDGKVVRSVFNDTLTTILYGSEWAHTQHHMELLKMQLHDVYECWRVRNIHRMVSLRFCVCIIYIFTLSYRQCGSTAICVHFLRLIDRSRRIRIKTRNEGEATCH